MYTKGKMLSNDIETTSDLLKKYNLNKDMRDDLTVYSDHSVFNSPSIETGRSRRKGTVKESPLSKYKSRENALNTPTKKLSDYQDYVSRARMSSFSGSPIKGKAMNLDINPKHSTSFTDTLDQEIDMLLNNSVLDPLDDPEPANDKTELIIKETHNLINTLPAAILGDKEGENYQKVLNASINKLLKQFEKTRIDLQRKTSELAAAKNKLSSFELKVYLQDQEITKFKKELSTRRPDATSKNDSDEKELLRSKLIKYRSLYNEAKKENEDLRSSNTPKISEENKQGKSHSSVRNKNDAMKEDKLKGFSDLEMLLAQLLEYLRNNHTPEEKANHHDDKMPVYNKIIDEVQNDDPKKGETTNEEEKQSVGPKMLSLFERLVEDVEVNKDNIKDIKSQDPFNSEDKRKPEPRDQDTQSNEDPKTRNTLNDISALLEKVVQAMEKNTEAYNTFMTTNIAKTKTTPSKQNSSDHEHTPIHYEKNIEAKASPRPTLHNEKSPPENRDDRDIVLKCYLCCPSNHKAVGKRPCQRCSTLSSENSDDISKDNKTINLMGEYKWSI
ncbi:Piso0_001919 [Millerozyma farinosa CBS 7064]|uniref:Piso0_001919 protein n=1 Tax=Pichia sorbitophila (strain ATCC MYA-4447 / BCRC 22081 / CBS 7064 / NBRC 10061 / NRRL Y-12695) TaxID=559304 RepID=G8YB75_PICSO|nr:Piso0_001919 [Millerozyma farinosa CBS 7064]